MGWRARRICTWQNWATQVAVMGRCERVGVKKMRLEATLGVRAEGEARQGQGRAGAGRGQGKAQRQQASQVRGS